MSNSKTSVNLPKEGPQTPVKGRGFYSFGLSYINNPIKGQGTAIVQYPHSDRYAVFQAQIREPGSRYDTDVSKYIHWQPITTNR